MEKGKSLVCSTLPTSASFQPRPSGENHSHCYNSHQGTGPHTGPLKPRSLVALCLGFLGRHLEDIGDDLGEVAATFPPDIKMAVLAIARRKKILEDKLIIALADSSWHILDVSSSEVTDSGLAKAVNVCKNLRAIDISKCGKISRLGVANIMQQCSSLETLRWGGCQKSDFVARSCLSMLKPVLRAADGASWEELDADDIADVSNSLRWLVWPGIDDTSRASLEAECPRIIVNPRPSPSMFRGVWVIPEALPDVALDDSFVRGRS